jgi:phospholipid/cholesterol/gamma-HCH transport system substrate-binding protein
MADPLLIERDPRFLRLRAKTWGFMLLGLALVGGGSVLILERQGYFVRKDTLHLVADTGDGLKVGLPLKFRGFTIGSVRALELNNAGLVDVTVEVAHKYQRWLRSDTNTRLVGSGLLGGAYIRVEGGSADKPPLVADAVIPLERDPSLEQLAQKLIHELHPIVDQSTQLLASLNDPHGHVQQTLAHAEALARGLNDSNRQLQELLANSRKLTERDLPKTMQQATATLASVQHTVDHTSAALPGILNKLDTTAGNAAELSQEAKLLLHQNAGTIGSGVSQGERLLVNGNNTLDGLRASWPLSKVLPAPAGPVLTIDSHD